MAKILVTGGAGFIGSHVVEAFLGAGHEVCVVDNLSTGLREFVPAGVSFYKADIRSPDLDQVFEREAPEIVSHHAAQMNVVKSVEDPVFDAKVNVVGSVNVLDCAVRHGAKKFIFASTGGAIYGEPETLPASETAEPRPLSPYGVSKLAFEQYLPLYQQLYGLNYTILRYPNVYGPRQNPHGEAGVCAIFIGKMLAGEAPTIYGDGKPMRDFVYVGDIARANVLAADRGDGQIINLGSGKGMSIQDLFEMLQDLLEFEGKPEYAPLRSGEVMYIFTTDKLAEEVLGWTAEVSLEEGLRRTIFHVQDSAALYKLRE